MPASPAIPAAENSLLLFLAVWAFCFPVVWGFSTRFLPALLGLAPPGRASAYAGLVFLAVATASAASGSARVSSAAVVAAAGCACWSLRIFRPSPRPPKTLGVDPRYPWFVRAAFGWLALAAILGWWGEAPGMTGASRHAFTAGFLASMIFAVGPRVLPAFLNSRELWSKRLMPVSLVLLTAGCALRVSSEPLAYAGVAAWAWKLLPVSAALELTAVLLFACNIARTLATPLPAWFPRQQVKDTMPLYWYVTSYPATRRLLVREGLVTLAGARAVPKSLTLREAVEADGADPDRVLKALRDFFDARLARAARGH